jgi:hypothetical protein
MKRGRVPKKTNLFAIFMMPGFRVANIRNVDLCSILKELGFTFFFTTGKSFANNDSMRMQRQI